MTSDSKWLADIIVLNESRQEALPGDVSVFRSAGEACAWLEHWWVENGEGFAFTAVGERLTLGVISRDEVAVISKEFSADGAELVRGWLQAYAAAILEARRVKAQTGRAVLSAFEARGQLPSSIEGLIAYVGFDR